MVYLARAAHSRAEVLRYLVERRRFSQDAARDAVAALEQEGLLDDRRLAERMVELSEMSRRAESRTMLARRLLGRGIAADIVRDTVSSDRIDELSAARKLARAKWAVLRERLKWRAAQEDGMQGALVERERRMLHALGTYLGRKGFASDIIIQILDEMGSDDG